MSNRLFLIQLQGPVHGSSISGEAIKKYVVTEKDYIVPINLAQNGKDIGRFRLKKLFLLLGQILSVIRLSMKVEKCILFYTSSGILFYRDLLFRFILRKKSMTLVMHNKGARNSRVPSSLKQYFFSNVHIIVLAKELVSDFAIFSVNSTISVIPNPLFERVTPPEVKDFSKLRFLYLSNLIRSKGVIESIELVKCLISLGMDASLDIVGSEVDVTGKEIKEMVGIHTDKIKYWGPQYGPSKVKFMQESNVFLFLSSYPRECSPLSIIEAMAYSMPVIALNNGGVKSLIRNKENGVLINSLSNHKDIQDLAMDILTFSAAEWDAMGRRSFERYKADHQLENWKNKMLDALK